MEMGPTIFKTCNLVLIKQLGKSAEKFRNSLGFSAL
jgi:hypothetical protein